MGNVTTVGKLLLKHNVPEDFHHFVQNNELESKNIGKLFHDLVQKHPEIYRDLVTKLTRLGFEVSTRMGSTVRLEDLLSPIDKEKVLKEVDEKVKHLKETEKDKHKFDNKLTQIYADVIKEVERDIVEKGVKENRTLAKIIRAGARGKPLQYRQTVFSPFLVSDAKGAPITDFAIRNSYAEGLTLPEYLLTTFNARAGEVSKKLAVAKAGYSSKQLSRAMMTIQVEEHDCGTNNGIPVSPNDKDSIGTFLARPALTYHKNNEVTAAMLNTLADKQYGDIIVRSPITCQSSRKFHNGAVCQLCAGIRENGLPAIGSYVGLTASSTLGEPLAQGQLGAKHSIGGVKAVTTATGHTLIDRLLNIPSHFPEKAVIAEKDGTITQIRPAPQGGFYIKEGEKEYYTPPKFDPIVKVGDKVEAGDVLTEGIPNPAEIVKSKGIGEGRKYFTTALKKAFDDSGMGGINRRNFELVAKGAIDHVEITDPDGIGDHLPGSIISYQAIEKGYQPRPNSERVRIDQSHNKFLEEPTLHLAIGDRMTHKRIEELKNHKIEHVLVHKDLPRFQPQMQRLLDVPIHEHDWMHQLYSTNLERRLMEAANTGSTSDLAGPSPIAGLAYSKDFGLLKKRAEDEELTTQDDESCEKWAAENKREHREVVRVFLPHGDQFLHQKALTDATKVRVPGGGIEAGEEPEDTVVREMQEEFGLNVDRSKLQYLGYHKPSPKLPPEHFFVYPDHNLKPGKYQDKSNSEKYNELVIHPGKGKDFWGPDYHKLVKKAEDWPLLIFHDPDELIDIDC